MVDQSQWIHPTPRSDGSGQSRVIISAGLGSSHYRRMLRSTENHCAVHCPETWRLFFDVLPEGAKPHSEDQYGFKIHALKRAVDPGYQFILWMDATCQPTASIEPLWEHVAREGFYVVKQGDAMLGSWTSDNALKIFGISRSKAMAIPLVYTGIVGLDMQSENGKAIWRDWETCHLLGAFNGPHFNQRGWPMSWIEHGAKWRGHCSFDPRCEGHRHDEAAMSFVLWKLGLKPVENPKGLTHYGIERHVPDYDVVKMREIIQYVRRGSGVFNLTGEEADLLCR
jgi:hypothetical protein